MKKFWIIGFFAFLVFLPGRITFGYFPAPTVTGLHPVPQVADSDGDGVPNDKDTCPGTPAGTTVDANGCPLKAISQTNQKQIQTQTNATASVLKYRQFPSSFKIAYDLLGDIYVMDPDGSNPINLTNNPANDRDPSWSPDHTKIAFVRAGLNSVHPQIYVMNADGSRQTNLTNNGYDNDFSPSWSPDSTKIAYSTYREGYGQNEIYVMNADGSNPTNLTNHGGGNYKPSWSPDGTKIAFYTNRDGNAEIYVMNADGSGQTNLTKDPGYDTDPSWSPDGTKIAFVTGRDGATEIYVMNALDGSDQVNLTNNPAYDTAPTWSRNGAPQIAFVRGLDIYVMDADGKGQTNLTNQSNQSKLVDIGNPDW